MSFCDISDVTNVESEPASNSALVLMDLDPFEKMTWNNLQMCVRLDGFGVYCFNFVADYVFDGFIFV